MTTPLEKTLAENAAKDPPDVPTDEECADFLAALNHLCESKGITVILGCGCCDGRTIERLRGKSGFTYQGNRYVGGN